LILAAKEETTFTVMGGLMLEILMIF